MRMCKTFWDPSNIVLLPRALARAATGVAHTQFARRMETKVVVATTWLSVGIDLSLHMKIKVVQHVPRVNIKYLTYGT